MKNLSFLIVLIFLTTSYLSAQDIILTFNPKDASNTIDSIKATMVKTGKTTVVEGANTINISSFTTESNFFPTNSEEISVYPNPFENVTQLQFYSNQNENIKVSLINSAGQVVAEKKQYVTRGIHQFNISTNNNGIYILNITGKSTKLSQKIISTGNIQSLNKIEYKGYSTVSLIEKSAEAEGTELIHLFVYSGDNITKFADSPAESKTYDVEFYECKDADGKSYPIVQIGDQWWMAENLAYLANVSPPTEGSGTEPYYYVYGYNDTSVSEAKVTDNYKTYGVLYNWPAAKAACPPGWHLPTEDEWKQLAQFVFDQMPLRDPDYAVREEHVGERLKTTSGWLNMNGTDDHGFSGLPGGQRDLHWADFITKDYVGAWWIDAEFDDIYYAWMRYLHEDSGRFYQYYDFRENGHSVRCVRD